MIISSSRLICCARTWWLAKMFNNLSVFLAFFDLNKMFVCRKRFFKNSGNSTLYNGLYGLIEFLPVCSQTFFPLHVVFLWARESKVEGNNSVFPQSHPLTLCSLVSPRLIWTNAKQTRGSLYFLNTLTIILKDSSI